AGGVPNPPRHRRPRGAYHGRSGPLGGTHHRASGICRLGYTVDGVLRGRRRGEGASGVCSSVLLRGLVPLMPHDATTSTRCGAGAPGTARRRVAKPTEQEVCSHAVSVSVSRIADEGRGAGFGAAFPPRR